MPHTKQFQAAVDAAHKKFRALKKGRNADCIPALAKMDPELFGIALEMVDGKTEERGDAGSRFTIQSISKVFTLANGGKNPVTGKSGVRGGIIAVAPGRFGIAAFSPPVDHTGNSVRAQKAIEYIATALCANPYNAHPQ